MLKRFGLIISLSFLFLLSFFIQDVNAKQDFIDLDKSNSHYNSIQELVGMGIINGYTLSDGRLEFRPNSKISRSHTAVLLTKALNLPVPHNVDEILMNFNDINSDHLYANQIASTYVAGIFKGSQGNFNDGELKREQMATVLVNAFNLKNTEENIKVNLDNVSPSHKGNVKILAQYGITNQLDDFRPHQSVTRGQFATFLYRTLQATSTQEHKIVSLESPKDITIVKGEEVVLPKQVKVRYENDTMGDVGITWDISKLDTKTIGEYNLKGTVEGSELTATIKVIVEEADLNVENVNVITNDDYSLDITGKVKNATSVIIYLNDRKQEEVVVNEDGSFNYVTGVLDEDEHKIQIIAYDDYFNSSNTFEKTIIIEKERPVGNSIETTQELQSYLEKNFSTLNTIIGKANFTFDILENDRSYTAYDYWIQVEYEYEFFGGAMNSIKYTPAQKETLYNQLKAHQKKLAESIITAMPNKKFYGGYYDSWYRYPTLRVDLITRRYFSWHNYEEPSYLVDDRYSAAKPSTFRWYDDIDDPSLLG